MGETGKGPPSTHVGRSGSAELFAGLLEAAPDAIVVVDTLGKIRIVNRQTEILFGYERDELIGHPVEKLVPDHARERHPELRGDYMRSPGARPMGAGLDLTGRRKDGTEFPVDISLAPLQTEEGMLVSAAIRDITARKRADEKFAALLEAAPDAMIVVDETGRMRVVNRQTESLFGYERSELIGQRVEMLVPSRVQDRHPALRSGYFAHPAIRPMGAGLDLTGRRKDGTEFPVDISLAPLETEEGTLVSAAVRDTTDRHRVQESLLQAKEEAERANMAKSDFLSRMSHELRTPLSAVLGFSDLLQMHEFPPEQRLIFMSRISKAGQHLLALIDDVLDISRVESGKLRIHVEPVGLADIIHDAIDLVQPMATERNIRIFAEAESRDSVVVADRNRLKQVLLNLLSNAVKYNREEGSVTIGVETTPASWVRVSVSDTGPGIPEMHLAKLFQPFERLGAEHGPVEGTGIGLALSSRLVELMDGRMGFESKEGTGSTFWLELPFAASLPASTQEETASQPTLDVGSDGHRATIVYVEDNLSNFMVVEAALALLPSIRLIPAIQGRLGMDLVRRHHPSLVLLDLNLPDVSGEEVLRVLKEDPETAEIPVVVISADALPTRVETLTDAGAYAYLTKPIEIRELLDLVQRLLAHD